MTTIDEIIAQAKALHYWDTDTRAIRIDEVLIALALHVKRLSEIVAKIEQQHLTDSGS